MLQTHYHRIGATESLDPRSAVYANAELGDFDWRHLFRHVRLFALSITICLALGLAYVGWRTPAYKAAATLLIDHKVAEFLQQDAIHAASNVSDALLWNQVAILRSEAIALKVIDSLGLEDHFSLVGNLRAPVPWLESKLEETVSIGSDGGNPADSTPPIGSGMEAMSSTLIAYNRNLLVEAPGMDHTITIQFTARDPELAAMTANEISRVYLQEQAEINERAARAARTASASLRDRLAELGTSARVLSPARPPRDPTGVGSSIVIAASVVGGLLFGLVGAFLREITGRRIYTPEEAAAASGAPYVAGLPRMRGRSVHIVKKDGIRTSEEVLADYGLRASKDQHVIQEQARAFSWALEYPLSRFAHGINRLSIAVTDNADSDGGLHRAIGMMSVGPKEGTTVVAANLAQVLAKRGLRVLLVDAVPHNRALSRGFSQEGPGLLEVLETKAEFCRAVRVDLGTGLHFLHLSAVSAQQATSGQIWCQAMQQLVKHEQYDYTIVDLPPIGLVPDVVAAARSLDGFILVVERGVVAMDLLIKTLASAGSVQDKLIGVVINKIKKSRWQAFIDGESQPRRAYSRYVNEKKLRVSGLQRPGAIE